MTKIQALAFYIIENHMQRFICSQQHFLKSVYPCSQPSIPSSTYRIKSYNFHFFIKDLSSKKRYNPRHGRKGSWCGGRLNLSYTFSLPASIHQTQKPPFKTSRHPGRTHLYSCPKQGQNTIDPKSIHFIIPWKYPQLKKTTRQM